MMLATLEGDNNYDVDLLGSNMLTRNIRRVGKAVGNITDNKYVNTALTNVPFYSLVKSGANVTSSINHSLTPSKVNVVVPPSQVAEAKGFLTKLRAKMKDELAMRNAGGGSAPAPMFTPLNQEQPIIETKKDNTVLYVGMGVALAGAFILASNGKRSR
jgi:hypothetical protein